MNEQRAHPADILIVDDNESDTMLMEEAIKDTMMANSVHIVHDAAEAINYLNKKHQYENSPMPDLILLDLNMPEFTGKEFLKVIKNDPRFAAIPVIILTGSENPKDITDSYRLGANCYIVKPANFMRFKKVISIINDFWLGIAKLPENKDK